MYFKSLFLLLLHCFLCDVMFHCRGNIAFIKKEREYKNNSFENRVLEVVLVFFLFVVDGGILSPVLCTFFEKRERRIFLFVFKFVSVCCKYL